MSCAPVCYDLAPGTYPAGIYSLQYLEGKPIWFHPPDEKAVVRVVTTPALISALNGELSPDKVVKCCDSCGGVSGDVSSLQQYQRCYDTGSGRVLLHGWARPPEVTADGAVTAVEKLVTGTVIQSDNPLIPATSPLSTLDMSSWTPSTGCCGQSDGGTTPSPDPTIRCYNREVPVSEPTSKPNNIANKGYAERTLWTIQQFENAGNVGATDAGFSSLISYDTDGIPEYNGEYAKANVTTINRNEGSAYGELARYEGYVYNPIRYPDNTNGKYVAKAELVDTYTGTAQADYSQLYVASDGGNYTLDRGDLTLADDNAAPGSSIYTLDPSQRGEYARFAYLNGDMGGASQFNIQMRLTYEDGSVQTLAMTNFLHQVGTLAYHAETELEPLVFNTVSGEWTKDGNPETVNTALGNLKQTPCGQLPITYNVWSEAGTIVFSGEFGGSGEGYEYSIDGGKTWQESSTFDLSESGALEIVPTVRDSSGTLSGKSGLSSHFPCVEKTWSADLITPDNNDTEYDDGAGNRGWEIEYSTQLGGNQMEAANNPYGLNWDLVETFQNNSYLYLGYTKTSTDNEAKADLTPVLPASEVGETYTVAFDPYDVRHGPNNSTTTFKAEITDNVTGAVLGFKEYTWAGNSVNSLTNETFTFSGSGNPVTLRFIAENDSNANDSTGHYIRINNVRLFEGQYSDGSHYARISGNSVFFRGIDGQAVYTSDAHNYNVDTTVVPKFDIRRYGTLDDTAGDVDRVTLQYQIDDGTWVTMLEHEGQFDVANEIYLSPYYYEKGVELPAGSEIHYRMIVDGTGSNAEGYYLYENSDVVRC